MTEIGSSGNRDIGKPNLTTEGRCSFASSAVKGFSIVTIFGLTTLDDFGIAGNSRRIGVSL